MSDESDVVASHSGAKSASVVCASDASRASILAKDACSVRMPTIDSIDLPWS